ncbi:MAG: hypothetical protein M3456_03470 [Actinomycetota bacterium]|nr:hypothetical protein [Actinomycetota bacterium]
MVDIVPALPEQADALRVRQLAAIRRFLEAVAENREAEGVSGLTDSVRRKAKTGQKASKQASTRSSEMTGQTTNGEKVADAGMRFAFYGRVSTEDNQDPTLSLPRQLANCESAV